MVQCRYGGVLLYYFSVRVPTRRTFYYYYYFLLLLYYLVYIGGTRRHWSSVLSSRYSAVKNRSSVYTHTHTHTYKGSTYYYSDDVWRARFTSSRRRRRIITLSRAPPRIKWRPMLISGLKKR